MRQYGVEQLRVALKNPTDTVTFFLGAHARKGLFYELEFGGLTKGFGGIKGGSSQKFVVWRADDGFRKRGPSRKPISCSEDEAVALLQSMGTTLLNMVERLAEPDFTSFWEAESDSLPILHLGWIHKYLALTTDILSYHHGKEHLRGHLWHLTGQSAPDNRWICDHLWRELFERTPAFQKAYPALLMAACFDSLPKLGNASEDSSETLEDPTDEESDVSLPILDSRPRNMILYGPPGTGKTYETARYAVEIIEGAVPTDRSTLMASYRMLQRQGRIAFVTFHQSYSYEDFVEGIRPVMSEKSEEGEGSSSGPRYEIVDGILKVLALEALGAMLVEKNATPKRSDFLSLWDGFLAEIQADPSKSYPGLSPGSEFTFEVYKGDRIAGTNIKSATSKSKLRTNRVQMEKIWDVYSDTQDTINTSEAFQTLTYSIHASVVCAVYNELKRRSKQGAHPGPRLDPKNGAKAEDFIENGDKSRYEIGGGVPDPYVLIVDEINRGNISKILGELITLLEDDKRLGSDNELMVTLPYSRDSFTLPPNLYLIGTMNTADKSLALLDVALRRRFSFVELPPKYEVCEPKLDKNMIHVFSRLNERIMLRKDRDHRIGHAFFMGVGSDVVTFNRVFEAKVLPLLQEYFASDWDGLRFVLGESDVKGSEGFVVRTDKIPGADDKRARNKFQWYTDADDPSGGSATSFDPLAQLLKNYGPP